MSDYVCFLITIYFEDGKRLIKVAIKVKKDKITDHMTYHPMSYKNIERFREFLPSHVADTDPIVDIERIEDVCEIH